VRRLPPHHHFAFFIDYILQLPEHLAVQLRRAVESIEEELNMPYVTSFERLAKQEGIEEGLEEGRREEHREGIEHGSLQSARSLVLQTIEIRFGQIPEELRTNIAACTSTDRLSDYHRRALLADSIDELPKQP
jgi:predicted transposase YdaD